MNPLVTLAVSMIVVIGLIVRFRLHAFLALLIGAMLVALLAPGMPLADAPGAVAGEFGNIVGRIGIIIALASFIGVGLQHSGGAARIGAAFLSITGPRRAHLSMWASGYVLSVPVFFDTVFYLIVPLVRAMHARAREGYVRILMAVMAGAAATHVFVPPTPGPLAAAAALNADLGLTIMIGIVVALVASTGGLAYAGWAVRRWPEAAAGTRAAIEADVTLADGPVRGEPGLFLSFLPIVLPVVLIASRTAATASGYEGSLSRFIMFAGEPNVALFLAAAAAMWLLLSRGIGFDRMAGLAEEAFASAGTIILITAAGGAYGGMLTRAGVGASLADGAAAIGLPLLLLAFLLASLLKFAQGSSTVAIITTASVLQATYTASGGVGLPHPVYAALAAAAGSLVGSWMNDSGFWVIAKMGGLSNAEALKLWSVTAAVVGTTGFIAVLVLSFVLPLH